MSAPRPLEIDLLKGAEAALSKVAVVRSSAGSFEGRLQVLEACASRLGGFDLSEYHQAFGIVSLCEPGTLLRLAEQVVAEIEKTPVHPAFALSALARESLAEGDRRFTGAYHTDFRLATRLADLAGRRKKVSKLKVIDPACGAGMLLVALTIANCGRDRAKTTMWLGESVCAADRSPNSLRSALLALASLTDDLSALRKMGIGNIKHVMRRPCGPARPARGYSPALHFV